MLGAVASHEVHFGSCTVSKSQSPVAETSATVLSAFEISRLCVWHSSVVCVYTYARTLSPVWSVCMAGPLILAQVCLLWHCDIIKLFLPHRTALGVANSVCIGALRTLDSSGYVHCNMLQTMIKLVLI